MTNKHQYNKLLTTITLVAVVSFGLVAHADFTSSQWQFSKTITPLQSNAKAGLAELAFDKEIFAKAKTDLSDVRVIDSQGREVPFVLATQGTNLERKSYFGTILNQLTNANYSSFVIDLGAGQAGVVHNQIEVRTNESNFRRQAMVEASDDLANWGEIASKSIYDYSLEFVAHDTTLNYTDSTYRYLRVKVLNNGLAAFKATGAQVYKVEATSAKEVTYPANILSTVAASEKRATQIYLDLGYTSVPTSRLDILTNSTSFTRAIGLEQSDSGAVNGSWRTVSGGAIIFSYNTNKFVGQKLSVEFPEQNARFFRLTIFNKDDQPINVTAINFYGLLRQLVFQYSPSLNYSLYYGNASARFPEYDFDRLLLYQDVKSHEPMILGQATSNSQYLPPVVPFSERFKGLLVLFFVLAVVVIGLLVWRLFKRTKPTPPTAFVDNSQPNDG